MLTIYNISEEVIASQYVTSLNNLVHCPACFRVCFFKGKRGLNVHLGKVNKN